jgi:hypothetical protein
MVLNNKDKAFNEESRIVSDHNNKETSDDKNKQQNQETNQRPATNTQ